MACGKNDFPQWPIERSPQKALHGPSGAQLTHYGKKTVKFRHVEIDTTVQITFEVFDIVRPIISVSKLNERGYLAVMDGEKNSFIQKKKPQGGRTHLRLGLMAKAGLFFL